MRGAGTTGIDSMKIMYVHENFGFLGGAESNIYTTARELKARGHQVSVAYEKSTGKDEARWKDNFEKSLSISDLNGHSSEMFANADLLYLHKCSKLKILKSLLSSKVPIVRMIHDHELCCMRKYKYNYWTRAVCHKSFSPYCLIPCGGFVGRSRDQFWPLKWISYSEKKAELDVSRQCDRFIVASEYMKMELVNNGFHGKKILIHAPVPAEGKKSYPQASRGKNIILFVGQITRGKGVDVLMKALALLQMRFQCFIVGDGHYRSYCENLSRELGLNDRVVFTGFLNPEQIEAYYTNADVLAVSSVWPEPFGLVGLEAMRYSLPTVAFDVGGIREWLSHGYNGLICRDISPQALAVNLRKMLSEKEMAAQMGENGASLLKEKFSFDKYMEGLENIMEDVVNEVRQSAVI